MLLEFSHIIDIIPFALATVILVFGAQYLRSMNKIKIGILFSGFLFLIAQGTAATLFLEDTMYLQLFKNFLFFIYNTLTLSILLTVLMREAPKDTT